MARFVPAANMAELAERDAKPARIDLAERIAQRAPSKAPRGTGRYARSVQVFDDDRGIGVETLDPAGHMVESGSINNPAYAPLRSTAKDMARRFDPK